MFGDERDDLFISYEEMDKEDFVYVDIWKRDSLSCWMSWSAKSTILTKVTAEIIKLFYKEPNYVFYKMI